MSTVYRAAAVHAPHLHAPGEPAPTALVVTGGRITWIGREADPGAPDPGWDVDQVVDLGDAVLAPAFVDAHAHVTETGLLLRGVDLRQARNLTQLLDAVAAAARDGSGLVLGHGWDERRLAEGRPPTAAELDRAAGPARVYLSRVDVHSAVISTALARACGATALDGWDGTGRVERDAHHAARAATRAGLTPADRREAQLAALQAAAGAGIAALHEMSAPHIASEDDLRELVALAGDADRALPQVVPYRGELVTEAQQARELVARLGVPLAGLGGDLCVDGSIGSRTAAWHEDYADVPAGTAGARGHLYLTVEQIRDHVAACTRAGLQAGFHVIGDAAVDAARRGIRRAAEQVGIAAVRTARHRLEHVEAIDHEGILDLADLRVTASVQPVFDALWGGDGGMYAARLGPARALALNPLGALAAAGVPLALGSDSPVTPFDPWGAVLAWVRHHAPDQRTDVATAFAAHTAGGWRAARTDGAGRLEVGAAATFAAWDLGARPDPHAPLAGLDAAPACLLTVGAGRTLHDVTRQVAGDARG